MNNYLEKPNVSSWKFTLPKTVFQINSAIYWRDFLSCIVIGWLAFVLTGVVVRFSPQFWLIFLIAILSLYKGVSFVHEIVHQQNNKQYIKGFISMWNIILGIPLLFPSYFYQCHLDHHKKHKTAEDPQYSVLKGNRFSIVMLTIIYPLMSPLFLIIRFLILSPLSIANSQLREFLNRKCSSLANPQYIAHFSPQQQRELYIFELLTFMFLVVVLLLFISGTIPIYYLLAWYFLSSSIWILNFFRVLGEHNSDKVSATKLTREERLLDSSTYSSSIFLQLLYVNGAQFHALHHLYPAIPYHNLHKAHKMLKTNLPQDSLYHKTEKLGHWNFVKDLWNGVAQ